MKKFEATIGFKDRYCGVSYETVKIEAMTLKSAEKKARDKGNELAHRYGPDYFFVESVKQVA